MSEALKCAWANLKLKAALKVKIVEFYFKRTDGTLRQAFGTLLESRVPETKVQVESQMITYRPILIQRSVIGVASRSVT